MNDNYNNTITHKRNLIKFIKQISACNNIRMSDSIQTNQINQKNKLIKNLC